jgi:hypothetical protein
LSWLKKNNNPKNLEVKIPESPVKPIVVEEKAASGSNRSKKSTSKKPTE